MRSVLTTFATIALALGLVSGPAAATTPPETAPATTATAAQATPVPATQPAASKPKYDYGRATRETVWVEAPDLDGNGEADRVAVDIIRPSELDGKKTIPVVMDASPYYSCCGRGNESEFKRYDARGIPTQFPLYYDNYFVPRGYAYAAVDIAGTSRSTGCTDEGADSDIQSVKAVIDWMNGRAKAVDRSGDPVTADWTNGKVGMIGKSYDGTLANGVAATGVEGLETIVPISAISSWYDYDRYQGLPFSYDYPTYLSEYVAGDRAEDIDCSARLDQMTRDDGDETGAYTGFWKARDYRDGDTYNVGNVKASVFIVHGLQDFNVKTPNFSRWWNDLGEQGVDRKMWLTRVGHVDPFDTQRGRWVSTLHRWFDHELMGIDNGIDTEPAVRAQLKPDTWVTSNNWPIVDNVTKLRPQKDGSLVRGASDDRSARFTNARGQTDAKAIATGDNPNRLLFTTGPLAKSVRLSGSAKVRLDIGHRADTGQVGVMLVDYGSSRRVIESGDGAHNLDTESCWGSSTADDDGCYLDTALSVERTPVQVLSRGWARLDEGDQQPVSVELTANDVSVPAGHQLGLVVVGASPEWVVTVDKAKTPYAIDLSNSVLKLPVKGELKIRSARAQRSLVPDLDEIPQGALANPGRFQLLR